MVKIEGHIVEKMSYKGNTYEIYRNGNQYILKNELEEFIVDEEEYLLFKEKIKAGHVQTSRLEILSFFNDMIKFNPYQYKPYLKLKSEENLERCIYIADEVGVGKTFETGIILSELLYNRDIRITDKILIVCPNMLCKKWQDVLNDFFGLASKIISDIRDINGISILPFHKISGILEDDIGEISLLVVDEAHNANGKRFESMMNIRRSVSRDYGWTILISGTPLSGQEKDFSNQKKLLFADSAEQYPDDVFEKDGSYFNRTIKEEIRDEEVRTDIETIYLREEYVEDMVEILNSIFYGKNTIRKYIDLQLIYSSPAAARQTLKRLEGLTKEELLAFLLSSEGAKDQDMDEIYEGLEEFDLTGEIGVYEADGEGNEIWDEKIEVISSKIEKVGNKLEGMSPEKDSKLKKLKEIVERNKSLSKTVSNGQYYEKIVVFTGYNETVNYLGRNLERSITVHGGMDDTEKWNRLTEFKNSREIDVLIITNVACEGQDMDFSNTLINYDLVYNPVQLEQRRGRLDRFEAKKGEVFIKNFAYEGIDPSQKEIEAYVRSSGKDNSLVKYSNSLYPVLLFKLQKIREETGIYYNVVDILGENSVSIDKNESKKKLVTSFKSIDGSINKFSDIMDCFNRIEQVRFDEVNRFLLEKEVKIVADDEENILVKTSKNNRSFLKNIYDGGTINSHLIYNSKGGQ